MSTAGLKSVFISHPLDGVSIAIVSRIRKGSPRNDGHILDCGPDFLEITALTDGNTIVSLETVRVFLAIGIVFLCLLGNEHLRALLFLKELRSCCSNSQKKGHHHYRFHIERGAELFGVGRVRHAARVRRDASLTATLACSGVGSVTRPGPL